MARSGPLQLAQQRVRTSSSFGRFLQRGKPVNSDLQQQSRLTDRAATKSRASKWSGLLAPVLSKKRMVEAGNRKTSLGR